MVRVVFASTHFSLRDHHSISCASRKSSKGRSRFGSHFADEEVGMRILRFKKWVILTKRSEGRTPRHSREARYPGITSGNRYNRRSEAHWKAVVREEIR
jgi:hypothetical protein